MPRQTAASVALSNKQRRILIGISKSRTFGVSLRTRASIVLMAADGFSNNKIEAELSLGAKTVKRWRDRFAASIKDLEDIESKSTHKLKAAIKVVLSDEARPGTPPTFGDEQVAAILALGCMSPEKLGLPFSHWSAQSLRDEAIVLGIVDDISVRQVGRYLNDKDLKPHRTKSWLNPNIEDFDEFQAEVQSICGIYLNIDELTARGVLVYSTDEKMGIQALEHRSAKKT